MKQGFSILIITLGLLNLSMYHGSAYDLLTNEDFEFARLSNKRGPVLSSFFENKSYWESYGEWLCFSTHELRLECTEHYFEETVKVPTVIISKDRHIYEFDVSTTTKMNCEDTLKEWKELLWEESSFCVFAAYLQELKFPEESSIESSLWILELLKTSKGSWAEQN